MAKIKRLASKPYRDVYLPSRVRAVVAMQIRGFRLALGRTQKNFANLIGTTQSVVSDLENPDGEQVSVQTLLNIAAALNVALIVRFASYPDFLSAMSDTSPKGLDAEPIDATIARQTQERGEINLSAPLTVAANTGLIFGGRPIPNAGTPSNRALAEDTSSEGSSWSNQSILLNFRAHALPHTGTSTQIS